MAKRRVDFVKIDVEGHEAEVWAGMTKIVADNPGLQVLMEFTPARLKAPAALLDSIQAAGFRLHEVTTGAEIRPVKADEILERRSAEPPMLWLSREQKS